MILLLRDASSKLIDVLFLLVWLYRDAFHSTKRMSDDVISPGHVVPVFPLRIIIFGSVSRVWPLIEALGMATYTIYV